MDLFESTVAQVLIPVDDLDRAVVFYRHTLGLPSIEIWLVEFHDPDGNPLALMAQSSKAA